MSFDDQKEIKFQVGDLIDVCLGGRLKIGMIVSLSQTLMCVNVPSVKKTISISFFHFLFEEIENGKRRYFPIKK